MMVGWRLDRGRREENQSSKASNEGFHANKWPFQRRKATKLHPQMLSSLNTEGAHIEAPTVESEREARRVEYLTITRRAEAGFVRELHQESPRTQPPRLPLPIPVRPKLLQTGNQFI